MKKQKGSPTGSGPNEPNSGKPSSPESPPLKTKLAKNKVQPIRGPSENGQQASATTQSQDQSSAPESASISQDRKSGKIRLPVPKLAVKRDRANDALKRLNVTPEQIATCPSISSFIRSNVRGGLKAALRAMRFTPADPTIVTFLEKYDSIPIGDRDKLPWEAIVVSGNIDVHHLMGATLFAVQSMSVNAVKFIALSNYPSIMKKTAEYAKMASGERDRATFHQGLGFLPSPKGPTFIGKAIFGGGGTKEVDEDDKEEQPATFAMEEDVNNLFPSATAMQNKLSPIRRLLESGDEEK